MSIVTPTTNIQFTTQKPVNPFSNTTHEVFHEYLRSQPNHYRFSDEQYDLFKRILLEKQGRAIITR